MYHESQFAHLRKSLIHPLFARNFYGLNCEFGYNGMYETFYFGVHGVYVFGQYLCDIGMGKAVYKYE